VSIDRATVGIIVWIVEHYFELWIILLHKMTKTCVVWVNRYCWQCTAFWMIEFKHQKLSKCLQSTNWPCIRRCRREWSLLLCSCCQVDGQRFNCHWPRLRRCQSSHDDDEAGADCVVLNLACQFLARRTRWPRVHGASTAAPAALCCRCVVAPIKAMSNCLAAAQARALLYSRSWLQWLLSLYLVGATCT